MFQTNGFWLWVKINNTYRFVSDNCQLNIFFPIRSSLISPHPLLYAHRFYALRFFLLHAPCTQSITYFLPKSMLPLPGIFQLRRLLFREQMLAWKLIVRIGLKLPFR